jgi:RNA polymerase sigma-70 factor (ECF subfamily)
MEREAVLRCQRGDREAFRRILDLHGDHLYRTALLITRDPGHAEEAVQEALLTAWKKIRTFDADRPFRPWINRILINCIGIARRRKRLPTAAIDDAMPLPDPQAAPERSVIDAETGCELRAALRSLSVEHRAVLVLRYFNDMSLPEIAESTGWRLGTVKSRLHRATAALRDAVAAREPAPHGGRAGEEA